MKILMIVFNQVGRGTYFRAYSLGQELGKRNHEVTLMATSSADKLRIKAYQDNAVRIIETPDLTNGPLRSGWDPWNIFNRLKWIDNQQFDLVQLYETRPTVIYPGLKLYKSGSPIFMDWADWFGKGGSVEERRSPIIRSILRPVETYYEEHFRKIALGTTVISRSLFNRAIDLGVQEDQLQLLPNGANTDKYFPMDQNLARKEFGIDENCYVIGYMGAIFLNDAKFMIESFNQVKRKFPNTKLFIIGYCPVDFSRLGVEPQSIIKTGETSFTDINMSLNCCDVLWLPFKDSQANRGRLPLKASDYLAVGKPIISTNVGDLKEFLQSGKFGAVVPDKPDTFAQETIALLADADNRDALGRSARQFAMESLQWSTMAQILERFYRRLM